MKCSTRLAMWPAICLSSFVSSAAAETLHSRGAGRPASLLQRDSALQTEVAHVLGSTPHDDLVDPYAPKHAGSPTLSKYCKAGHNQDPACRADGKTEELVDEIEAVKVHMRCMFHPETCPAGMDPTGKTHAHQPEEVGSNVANGGKKAGEGPVDNSSQKASSTNSGTGNTAAGSGNDAGAGSAGAGSAGASSAGADSKASGGDVGNAGTSKSGAGKGSEHSGSEKGGAGGGAGSGSNRDGADKSVVTKDGGDAKSGAGSKDSSGSGNSGNAMCTAAQFKTRVNERHGDSDESFRIANTNHDQSVSRGEFETLGAGVGCSAPSSNKVFENFKRGSSGHGDEEVVDEEVISEEEYKDFLLATPHEVARRLREKHGSPKAAYAAADSDHSNTLTEKEVGDHCATVAQPDACRVVQERLGTSPSRQEYEDFVQYGNLPPSATTGTSSTKAPPAAAPIAPTAAPTAAPTTAPKSTVGDKQVSAAERQEARLERQHVEDKIVELAKLKHKLKEDEALDSELGRAMTGVIENSEVFSGALEDVGDGKVTDADTALAEVESSADNVDVAAFDLETGVHPHGLKWWRFRWEYSLIEAIMLIFLIILVILAHQCINKGQSITAAFMPTKMVGFSSMLNLHNITFTTCVKEFAVLGVLQGVIWLMNQFGFFDWMLTQVPKQVGRESLVQVAAGFSMHLPNTGADLVYTLRCVNMHLFLGIAFYFVVMYHVVVSAIHIFSMFLEAEDSGAHEKYLSALSVEHFLTGTPRGGVRDSKTNSKGGMPQRRGTSIKELTTESTSAALRWTGGCLSKTQDFHTVRRYFIHHVLKRDDLCQHIIEKAELADDQALDDTLHRIFLYRYLSVHIRKRLIEMIIIDFRIWLALVLVLVSDVVLHVYAHVSFVELLPLYITIAFSIQMYQIYHAHSQLKHIVSHGSIAQDAKVCDTSEEERHGTSFGQRHRLDLWTVRAQQLILLLICYSGARVLASPYLWTDYFKLSCFITAVLFLLYIFHVFIGSIWITLDMIVYSLPPYINDDAKVAMVETINEAKSYTDRMSLVPF